MSILTWVPVRGGHLAVSGRPKARAFPTIASEGATHVLTLLAAKEDAPSLGKLVESAGMEWIWFPLENGNPLPKARDAEVASLLGEVKRLLDQNARILIHCSAGIHRTGMIANAILRWTGHDAHVAREKLAQLRTITAEGMGDRRLAYALSLIHI